MSNNETLFDKAKQNLNCAITLYNSNLIEDEAYLNYVGYHLQQAVELAIKYQIEMNGVEYSKTHDIEQLIQLAQSRNADLYVSDYIYDKAEMFSSWEAKTRYIMNYKLERKKVSTAIIEVNKYIDKLVNELSQNYSNSSLSQENNDSFDSIDL